MRGKFANYLSSWLENPLKTIGLVILSLAMLAWGLGITVELFKTAPGIYVTALLGGSHAIQLPKFCILMYKIATILFIIYFTYGLIFFMKPVDVFVSVVAVVAADFLILFAVDAVVEILALSIIAGLLLLAIGGVWGTLIFLGFPYLATFMFPIFAIVLPVALVVSAGIAGSILSIIVLVAFIITEIGFYIFGVSNTKRHLIEIPITLLTIVFIAWPALTVFYNIREPFHNQTGYEIREELFNSDYNSRDFDRIENILFGLKNGYYREMINPGDNGNLQSGGTTHVFYTREPMYDQSDFEQYRNSQEYEQFPYYVSATYEEGTICRNTTKRYFQQLPYKGKETDDPTVVQYKNRTVVIGETSVYVTSFGESGSIYNKKKSGWYKDIKNLSNEELFDVIMTKLEHQKQETSGHGETRDFALLAYAQARGILLDYNESEGTGYFAAKSGDALTLYENRGQGTCNSIGGVEVKYNGKGTGYFLIGDELYYINANKIMKYSIRSKNETEYYEIGDDSVVYFNYLLKDNVLTFMVMNQDGDLALLRNGKRIKLYENQNQFAIEDVVSLQVNFDDALICYRLKKPTVKEQIWRYIKNESLRYERVHYLNAAIPQAD